MNKSGYSFVLSLVFLVMLSAGPAQVYAAESYTLDPAHSFVEFKIPHLGYSVLVGRFNEVEGGFTYDEANPSASNIDVTVNTVSIDSNHAKRDKHLKSEDFLEVGKYPKATFKSTSISQNGDDIQIKGMLEMHGVKKEVTIDAEFVGAGPDPWGGYRRGYKGTMTLGLKDFGINYDLGPASTEVTLGLFIEGIRDK